MTSPPKRQSKNGDDNLHLQNVYMSHVKNKSVTAKANLVFSVFWVAFLDIIRCIFV